ncbi:MAG: hypothetical protein OXE78_01215, partial [Gammaproteobacteria bacterium]|nr:hypothetical protein [Gammaproteobacteria bacterium]
MNIDRIKGDIAQAKQYFGQVEGRNTPQGGVMAIVTLQTSTRRIYMLGVNFPESYPNAMPEVYVRKPTIGPSPHRYPNNQLCYLHPHMWNPGRHDLTFVIER